MTFVVETFTAIENLEVLLVLACEEVEISALVLVQWNLVPLKFPSFVFVMS